MQLLILLATFATVLSQGIPSLVAETRSPPEQTTGQDISTGLWEDDPVNIATPTPQPDPFPIGLEDEPLNTEDGMETEGEAGARPPGPDIGKASGIPGTDAAGPTAPEEGAGIGDRLTLRPSKNSSAHDKQRPRVRNSGWRPSPSFLGVPLIVAMTYVYYA